MIINDKSLSPRHAPKIILIGFSLFRLILSVRMLNRQYLDLRCSSNDPGRVRDERCRIDEHPTDPNAQQSPQIEPCGVGNFNYKPVNNCIIYLFIY